MSKEDTFDTVVSARESLLVAFTVILVFVTAEPLPYTWHFMPGNKKKKKKSRFKLKKIAIYFLNILYSMQ